MGCKGWKQDHGIQEKGTLSLRIKKSAELRRKFIGLNSVTVLERVTGHIQPIRIFHARHAKSLLARLPLAPWRPLRHTYLLPLNNSSSSSP